MKPPPRPLSYCTNVHPATTLAQVVGGLDQYAVAVARNLGQPLAVGLWFSQGVAQEILAQPDGPQHLAGELQRLGLSCYTLNAFPFGDFHAQRVKENVYLPDWSDPHRLAYTKACADILVALLPPGAQGSISTLPLAFKAARHLPGFQEMFADNLIQCARHLDHLYRATGKMIRLAIEPEPLCLLETTAEAAAFFHRLWLQAEHVDAELVVREHVGLCYDVCHQAVEFENPVDSIAALHAAGVRINKVQLSCALQLDHPGDAAARAALLPYVEERYLHQIVARDAAGSLHRQADLTQELIAAPPAPFASAETWRIHFHVPLHAQQLGLLSTTGSELPRAISAIAKLDYWPDLEVETYTWTVLPAWAGDLVDGLSRELSYAYDLLASVVSPG